MGTRKSGVGYNRGQASGRSVGMLRVDGARVMNTPKARGVATCVAKRHEITRIRDDLVKCWWGSVLGGTRSEQPTCHYGRRIVDATRRHEWCRQKHPPHTLNQHDPPKFGSQVDCTFKFYKCVVIPDPTRESICGCTAVPARRPLYSQGSVTSRMLPWAFHTPQRKLTHRFCLGVGRSIYPGV